MDFYAKVKEKYDKFKSEFEEINKEYKIYLTKYKKLIDLYLEFIIAGKHEGFSPFIYLDSPGGYPTIGYGHLLYFKRQDEHTKSLMKELGSASGLKIPTSIDKPQEIFSYFPTVSENQLLSIYDDKNVCLGLLDALSFPFKISQGKIIGRGIHLLSTSPFKNDQVKTHLTIDAFNELLKLSILLAVRADRQNRKVNQFLDYKFYTPTDGVDGSNNLVVDTTFCRGLAQQDAAIKVRQLILPIDAQTQTFPEYDTYPLEAQLALLELSYNAGVFPFVADKNFYNQVINKKWEELSKRGSFPRRKDPALVDRNNQVKTWFRDAAKAGVSTAG